MQIKNKTKRHKKLKSLSRLILEAVIRERFNNAVNAIRYFFTIGYRAMFCRLPREESTYLNSMDVGLAIVIREMWLYDNNRVRENLQTDIDWHYLPTQSIKEAVETRGGYIKSFKRGLYSARKKLKAHEIIDYKKADARGAWYSITPDWLTQSWE